jgi:hypothetical protein
MTGTSALSGAGDRSRRWRYGCTRLALFGDVLMGASRVLPLQEACSQRREQRVVVKWLHRQAEAAVQRFASGEVGFRSSQTRDPRRQRRRISGRHVDARDVLRERGELGLQRTRSGSTGPSDTSPGSVQDSGRLGSIRRLGCLLVFNQTEKWWASSGRDTA